MPSTRPTTTSQYEVKDQGTLKHSTPTPPLRMVLINSRSSFLNRPGKGRERLCSSTSRCRCTPMIALTIVAPRSVDHLIQKFGCKDRCAATQSATKE